MEEGWVVIKFGGYEKKRFGVMQFGGYFRRSFRQ